MKSLLIPLFNFESFTQTINYLGAIQGLIMAVIVWNYPRNHKISNRILSLFLISLVYLYIGPRVVEVIDSPYKKLYFGFRTISPMLLILYIYSLYQKLVYRKHLWLLIIIPIDIFAFYKISQLRIDTSISFIEWQIVGHSWFLVIYLFFVPIILRQYKNYKKKVLQNFSSTHRIGLKWITQLSFGYLFLITFDFILSLIANSFSFFDDVLASLLSTLAFTVFIYFITIKGRLSSQIYQLRNLDDAPIYLHVEQTDESEDLPENKEINALSEKIIQNLEAHKLYKEMGLTVNDLAEKIESQPYLVSQAINVSLGKNFFELINRYRIEEAKSMLADESWNYLSIVGIGFEAGFNSKTTFNTTFKKYVGMTPSEYKRQVLKKTG